MPVAGFLRSIADRSHRASISSEAADGAATTLWEMESEFAANATAVVSALISYERRILPLVRAELERWRERAIAIPDPLLRAAALTALRDKGRNVEATAVFAILAPRARRAGPLRAMTALQVAIDYLDSLGEQPVDDPLADGLALHEPFVDAVSPGACTGDWYRLTPARGRRLSGGPGRRLPGGTGGAAGDEAGAAAPAAGGEALRRGTEPHARRGPRRHRAARGLGNRAATTARAISGGRLAAGASSSVAAHALIAAAAEPRRPPRRRP